MALWRLACLAMLLALAATALAQQQATFPDAARDERLREEPGRLEATGLVDCDAPSADVLATHVAREADDLVVQVTVRNRAAPLRCLVYDAPLLIGDTVVSLTGEAHQVYVIADSKTPAPNGTLRYGWAVFDVGGASPILQERGWRTPSELWQGDTWTVRLPVAAATPGASYDLAGQTFTGETHALMQYVWGLGTVAGEDWADVGPLTVPQ